MKIWSFVVVTDFFWNLMPPPPWLRAAFKFAWNTSLQPQKMQQKTRNLQETTVAYGLWGLFPSIIGGTPPLVNGDLEICMELTPPTSKNETKNSKFARNHWGQWLMRCLFHLLLGGPPFVNADLTILMEIPTPTSKMRQNTIHLQETTEANGLWGHFPIYYWGDPPGKRGLEICIELPTPTSKNAAKTRILQETTEANGLWGLFSIC